MSSRPFLKEKLQKMKRLAGKISQERMVDENVEAVLLFGSVAKGNVHADSDIDLVVVKDTKDDHIDRNELFRNNIQVDLWEHSWSYYKDLVRRNFQPSEMFKYSLFLNVLQECVIIYDRDSRFGEYKEQAVNWAWPNACKEHVKDRVIVALDIIGESDIDVFEKLILIRKMFLLDLASKLMNIGKPVSIRNKDYYLKSKEHFSVRVFEEIFGRIPDTVQVEVLVENCLELFNSEVSDRGPWTELKNAESYCSSGDPFMTTISLQNGMYYLGCEGLSNRDISKDNKGFLRPESEIELIRKAKKHWIEFYELYRMVHNVDAWPEEDIDSALDSLKA